MALMMRCRACGALARPRTDLRLQAHRATSGEAHAEAQAQLAALMQPSLSQQRPPASYPYNAGEGERRQKATIEHVWGGSGAPAEAAAAAAAISAPWAVGWQVSERNLLWNDELKLRLVKRAAAQELGLDEAELEERLHVLHALLPTELAERLVRAPPARVAALAANTDLLAERLLRLKALFPDADIAALVGGRLSLLLDEDLDAVAAAAARLRALLPGLRVDRFVQAFPAVLDVEDFERALDDAGRLLPGTDVQQLLRSSPDTVLSLMKGASLIPYDQIANPWT